jgi:hypothetical protein
MPRQAQQNLTCCGWGTTYKTPLTREFLKNQVLLGYECEWSASSFFTLGPLLNLLNQGEYQPPEFQIVFQTLAIKKNPIENLEKTDGIFRFGIFKYIFLNGYGSGKFFKAANLC